MRLSRSASSSLFPSALFSPITPFPIVGVSPNPEEAVLISYRLTRWLSTFIAAWFSLKLLQSKTSEAFVDVVSHETPAGIELRTTRFAGRTMDLTLFAVTRASDVVIGELWSQRKDLRKAAENWTMVSSFSLL